MDIITLIKELVTGLLNAEEEFLKHLDTFPKFEETVHELTDRMAADFMGAVLTNADTLISSAGDITYMHTLYKDKDGRVRCLLDELLRLPERERFTCVAEAKVLNEAEAHSEMVKHFCNTNTEKISLYYEYLFSNGVRYPFDECGRM